MTDAVELIVANGDYPVHPAAEVFPMLEADELADLAASIAEKGLLMPLVLDAAGEMLVDGRNRRAACEIAGVEPRYERLAEDIDPVEFIEATNIDRRHLTMGQRAMARAMLYPEAKRGMHSQFRNGTGNVSKARLSEARTILRGGSDLARQVMAGSKQFADALRDAQERAASDKGEDAQIRRLREEAPDVAVLVVEGRLSLTAGIAELENRLRARRAALESGRRSAERIASGFAADALAIIAALELGEPIRLDAKQQVQIKQILELLNQKGVLS